jgi:hypothetical protein
MAFKYKGLVIPAFLGLLMGVLAPSSASAYDEPDRTGGRSAFGLPFGYPDWLTVKPPHYEFSALVSNSDPLTQHPNQWDGQDWDPNQWGPGWTTEAVLKKFFKARIFTKRYMSRNNIPAVELGPTFYKLSDLDQRRTLKLLTDQGNIFGQGYQTVHLVDWSTHDVIGVYTPKGMFLN